MKRRLRLAASVWLILGLALGVAISYNGSTKETITSALAGCPVYPTPSSLLNRAGSDWTSAAQLGDRIGQAAGVGDVPRRNFIDDYIFDAMEKDRIPHAGLCTDEEFMRRAYLDLIGRIPARDQVQAFMADRRANKREALIDSLIGSPEYVDRMVMYFGDLLQNTSALLGRGRIHYNNYIRDFLKADPPLPYYQLMYDLITSEGDNQLVGPVNFLGRSWEPMAVRYDTIDNVTAEVGRVFLGQTLMCISCHNGLRHLDQINLYLANRTRYEFWNLAAFLSGLNYDFTRGTRFVFKEENAHGYDTRNPGAQGGVRPARRPREGDNPVYAPIYFFNGATPQKAQWRDALTDIIREDKQFARTIVNYIWKELMGVGIVDAADAFDLARLDPNNPPPEPEWTIQPTNPYLLEALAQDFIDHDFNLQHLMGTIMKSSTYQLSAAFPGKWEGRYANYFARHFVRRMPAEAVFDSITQATEVWMPMRTSEGVTVDWTIQLGDPVEPAGGGTNLDTRNFLNKFFRGSRNGSPRRSEGSVQQVLELLNNRPLIYNRLKYQGGGIVDRLLVENPDTPAGDVNIVEELFLVALSRRPTVEEKSQALQRFTSQGRSRAAENLLYALVNKLDFLHY